jgi:hypothetical protein
MGLIKLQSQHNFNNPGGITRHVPSPSGLQNRPPRSKSEEIRPIPVGLHSTSDVAQFTELLCHRDSVEARGNFVASHKSRGNENRRWHGTKRKCNIGDKESQPSARTKGAHCVASSDLFRSQVFRGRTGWGRFGAGIYTSSTSSKFCLY